MKFRWNTKWIHERYKANPVCARKHTRWYYLWQAGDVVYVGIVENESRTCVTRVCAYIRECASAQRPLSVLVSHQFLLWRTRRPGSKKPSWYQPSRCLDPDSIESASRAVFDTTLPVSKRVRAIESETGREYIVDSGLFRWYDIATTLRCRQIGKYRFYHTLQLNNLSVYLLPHEDCIQHLCKYNIVEINECHDPFIIKLITVMKIIYFNYVWEVLN